jgi:hypothetical protein
VCIGTALPGDDAFTLKRIPVNTDDDPALQQAKLDGAYDWMHAVQHMSKSLRTKVGFRREKSIVKWVAPH